MEAVKTNPGTTSIGHHFGGDPIGYSLVEEMPDGSERPLGGIIYPSLADAGRALDCEQGVTLRRAYTGYEIVAIYVGTDQAISDEGGVCGDVIYEDLRGVFSTEKQAVADAIDEPNAPACMSRSTVCLHADREHLLHELMFSVSVHIMHESTAASDDSDIVAIIVRPASSSWHDASE